MKRPGSSGYFSANFVTRWTRDVMYQVPNEGMKLQKELVGQSSDLSTLYNVLTELNSEF